SEPVRTRPSRSRGGARCGDRTKEQTMIEARQRIAPNGEALPVGVLDLLAALAAAIEEIREEMARHGMVPRAQPGPERAFDAEAAGARLEALSKRQRQVLSGIVRGCASKIIAWELG